jgi:hypothetical protein
MHAQSVNPLFPNVSLPVREKAVVGEPAKKSEYTGQPIAPAEVRHFLQCIQYIHSITVIQIIHPSPFAEVPLQRARRSSVRVRRISARCDVAQSGCDVAQLVCDVAQLGSDVAQLGSDVAQLGDDVAQFRGDVGQLGCDVAQFRVLRSSVLVCDVV